MSSKNIYTDETLDQYITEAVSTVDANTGTKCVYIYIDQLTNTPFYVGKGSILRSKSHIRRAISNKKQAGENLPKFYKIRKLILSGNTPTIKYAIANVDDVTANKIERIMICKIGRKWENTGPLLNFTDGGEGLFGMKRPQSFKDRISLTSSKAYRGIPHHNPSTKEIKHFHEGEAPDGWVKGNGIINKHTLGTVFYHNPETKEQIRVPEGTQPDGWLRGRAVFNNSFTGKDVKRHIITGETICFDKDTTILPLYASPKATLLYTYTDLNGNKKCTCAKQNIIGDLNLDNGYFNEAMSNDGKLIGNRTTSNGLNRTHRGMHIKDVYGISMYPISELTLAKCNEILRTHEWN